MIPIHKRKHYYALVCDIKENIHIEYGNCKRITWSRGR